MNKYTTIDYYEKHADTYFQTTYAVDMSPACDRFLAYLPTGGRIIDIGCGSGRDLKYFGDRSFSAEGLDASKALCEKAGMYTGLPVSCVQIQNWNPGCRYDGIWCCATLLHLTKEEIFAFLHRAAQALEPEGVIFISAKCGIETGCDALGRYFTDFSEELIGEISEKVPELDLAERWYTADGLGRIDVRWVNMIYRRRNFYGRV